MSRINDNAGMRFGYALSSVCLPVRPLVIFLTVASLLIGPFSDQVRSSMSPPLLAFTRDRQECPIEIDNGLPSVWNFGFSFQCHFSVGGLGQDHGRFCRGICFATAFISARRSPDGPQLAPILIVGCVIPRFSRHCP